jgi:uncharacterized protein
MMIDRSISPLLQRWLAEFPAVGLLGPRQCGKSTLAKALLPQFPQATYLDLENPSDLARLQKPELYLSSQKGKLVCLDEIQRAPELFPMLRGWLDAENRPGCLLVLGSASPELLRQSSESLAGRIGFLELTPLLWAEVTERSDQPRHLMRGGYPRSFLATSERASRDWRQEFIRTHIERDLPMLHSGVEPERMRRFWTMASHHHGQLWNGATIAQALGVSQPTVRRYLEILQCTFMLRELPPWEANLKKRLVRSPKVYVRDSGLLWNLLGVSTWEEAIGHPNYGAAWEGWVLEQLLSVLPYGTPYGFYRTAAGTELDLVVTFGSHRLAFECKASSAPHVTKGFWLGLEDLAITEAYVVAPVTESYPIGSKATVISTLQAIRRLQELSPDT